MSAEAWVFDAEAVTPKGKAHLVVRYIGPDWENTNDPPTTDLTKIDTNDFDIWMVYAPGEQAKEIEAWVHAHAPHIINGLRLRRQPDWRWDT